MYLPEKNRMDYDGNFGVTCHFTNTYKSSADGLTIEQKIVNLPK